MNLVKLGNILKTKREELGLSLRDASKLVSLSHNYLSVLEKAKDPKSNMPIKPTIDTLKLLSDGYKMDINELLVLAGYDFEIVHKEKPKLDEGIKTIAAHRVNPYEDISEEGINKINEYIEMIRIMEQNKK